MIQNITQNRKDKKQMTAEHWPHTSFIKCNVPRVISLNILVTADTHEQMT